MFIEDWKKEVFTIPNMLSLFRLFLLPIYAYIYLTASGPFSYYLAGSIMALSCMTDMADGKIARKYNMISTLGKILDPLADKVTQFTLTLCLSLKYPVLRTVLTLFIIKELFQLITGYVYLRMGKILPNALFAGKLCTTVLFVSLIALVLFPSLPLGWVDTVAFMDIAFLSFSFVSYVLAYFGKHRQVEDWNPGP